MKRETPYFKHDIDASSDLKLRAMRRKYGWQSMGWYWFIVECLRSSVEYKLPYDEFTFDSFSEELEIERDKFKGYLDDCVKKYHLFIMNGDNFHSDRLNRNMAHMEDVSEARRESRLGKTRTPKENPEDAEGVATIAKCYEDNMGMITPIIRDKLVDISDTYPAGWFEKAVGEAVINGVKKLPYVIAILERWKAEGINTKGKKVIKKPKDDGGMKVEQ